MFEGSDKNFRDGRQHKAQKCFCAARDHHVGLDDATPLQPLYLADLSRNCDITFLAMYQHDRWMTRR